MKTKIEKLKKDVGETILKNIKKAMKKKKINQSDIARTLNFTRQETHNIFRNLEYGGVKLESVIKIAIALNISPYALFCEVESTLKEV